jgi:D-glycero-D-manno-heptose 1,7-bisphosphate phosphatase
MDGSAKKVVFLDRDGTINVDAGFVHKIDDWEWCAGAIEALKKLQDSGFKLVVVTNQSGIGHGLYTEKNMNDVHTFLESELKKHGVSLAAIFFCPHKRDAGCDCRKPRAGMIDGLEEKIGNVDFNNSWIVGDKAADIGFGKNMHVKTALIKSKYWEEDELEYKPDIIVESLLEATKTIINSDE